MDLFNRRTNLQHNRQIRAPVNEQLTPPEAGSRGATCVDRGPAAAYALSDALAQVGFTSFFGTPCGVLAPLYSALTERCGLITVPREDNAIGLAAGAALAGERTVVLMQNSGLGQSINALASLIVPYRIPILLVVSLRGHLPDTTAENLPMGQITVPVLSMLGMTPMEYLPSFSAELQAMAVFNRITIERLPSVMTISPDAFDWSS